MSETNTSVATPPLATTEHVETQPAGGGEAKSPDFSKLLQKEQMQRANLERSFGEFREEISGKLDAALQARTVAEKKDALMELEASMDGAEGAEMEKYLPGITKTLKVLTQEVRSGRAKPADTSKVEALEARLAAKEEFDAYMADKSPEFRKAYTTHQKELMAELREAGEEVDEKALRIAMRQFAKGWKDPDGEEPPEKPAKTAPGGKPVIPAASGARHTVAKDPLEVLRSGHVQDKDGNIQPGNLLGI